MTKAELRHDMRERLRAIDHAALQAASEKICRTVAALPQWREARLVAAFLPMPREPQIQPLWLGDESERVFCFPQVRGEQVVLLRVNDRAVLEGADWKLGSPEFARCPTVPPAEFDAIIVAGVAFTRDGRRLGRGGGYYDRLLAQCGPRTARIGVCFATQIVDALPLEAHDQRVDIVITE